MQLYLTYAHIPDLAVLPPSVRGLVRQRALAKMPSRAKLISQLPVIFSVAGGLLGAFAGAWAAALLRSGKPGPDEIDIVGNLLGVTISGFACGFIGMQLHIRKLRPYLSKAIEDYVTEITHAD